VIQAPRDTDTVQYNLCTECNLLVPDFLVSLQQAKTCNSQKYRVTEQAVCM